MSSPTHTKKTHFVAFVIALAAQVNSETKMIIVLFFYSFAALSFGFFLICTLGARARRNSAAAPPVCAVCSRVCERGAPRRAPAPSAALV